MTSKKLVTCITCIGDLNCETGGDKPDF